MSSVPRSDASSCPSSTDGPTSARADTELQDLGSSRAEAPQTNGPAEKWSPGSADGDVSSPDQQQQHTAHASSHGGPTSVATSGGTTHPASPLPVSSASTGSGNQDVQRPQRDAGSVGVGALPSRHSATPPSDVDGAAVDRDRDSSPTAGENDYDKLDLQRAQSPQHVYRPILETPNNRHAPVPSASTAPSRPPPGVSPPAYDSFGVSFSPPPPPPPHEKRPLLQQPLTHPYITNADDIIELQSDVPTTSQNPELSQNQQNAKKEKYIKPEVTDIPNTNFAIACMVALCFNLPLGVVAMYCSLRAVKAYQDGKRKLGERRSRWSIIFSLLGITITTVIISSVVLWIAVQGQKRISRHKAYGTKSGLNL